MNSVPSTWLAELKVLAPPPPEPRYGSGDWAAVASRLGAELPSDYVELVKDYGVGQFDKFIVLLSPFCPGEFHNLLVALSDLHDATQYTIADGTPGFPYTPFQDKRGLLPFAWTANDDWMFWQSESDDPESWTTRIFSNRSGTYEDFPMGATALLCKLFSREVKTTMFPDDFPSMPRSKVKFEQF
ncbi:MAG: hypothetical protein JWO08_4156 [Verrucomicrobiaceae bacterium]|nr:hypothetical protein [Verrucomicrobiaceae bacterium]